MVTAAALRATSIMLLRDAEIGMVQERRGKPDRFRRLLPKAADSAVAQAVRRHGDAERRPSRSAGES
jgi:hypothetical protein